MANTPIGSTLDIATVVSVGRTHVNCVWVNKTTERKFKCFIPQPYHGNGGGVLVGIEKGTKVVVGIGPGEQKFIVATIPIKNRYFDQEGVEGSDFRSTSFPELAGGEIMLKSSASGSYIDIHPRGTIMLDAGLGDGEADIELSPTDKAMFIRVDNRYNFTEAGRSIEGRIKRDKHKIEEPNKTNTFDFLGGQGYGSLLTDIGRSPKDEVKFSTRNATHRNPSLIEKRNIVYEYADSFGVRDITSESESMIPFDPASESGISFELGTRSGRRTDVLNLGMFNFNHLIEKVEGTLVDIYGNVLDINRNIIDVPDIKSANLREDGTLRDPEKERLLDLYTHLRRSVKYHFEINSRKDLGSANEPDRTKVKTQKQQREHSRWSIDVDGEGLTKINIPSSSDIGNIPVLSRYLTSRAKSSTEKDDASENDNRLDDGSFRDKDSKDIRVVPFAEGGPTISNSSYKPEVIDGYSGSVTAGTAYHDLLKVASVLFDKGTWGKKANGTGTATNRISPSVNNAISDDKANAGGRSVHANLDGSAEISIGADTIDNKSLLLDLEGGVVSHYGADTNGRSIIHQSDGTVLIQIGDKDGSPGRLEIHLVNGSKSQKIIIDEGGMTVDVQGTMVLNASGDFGINAKGRMLLNAASISMYGSVDADNRIVSDGGTRITQSGLAHIGMFG